MIFLYVLIGIGLIAATLIGLLGPALYFIDHDDYTLKVKIITYASGVLLSALAITIGISLIGIDNGSSHCGNGTIYRTRYDVATKTSDWWCE